MTLDVARTINLSAIITVDVNGTEKKAKTIVISIDEAGNSSYVTTFTDKALYQAYRKQIRNDEDALEQQVRALEDECLDLFEQKQAKKLGKSVEEYRADLATQYAKLER